MFCSFLKREKNEMGLEDKFQRMPETVKSKYKDYFEFIKNEQEWFLGNSIEILKIENDGYILNGYYLSQGKSKTAIIIHGYKSDALSEAGKVRFYFDMGYNIFLPDLRSHGKSQGKYIGMGCTDQDDIIKWLELIKSKEENNCKILLVGFSMGGATALALSGNLHLPPNVFAIISHSAFTSLKELVNVIIKIRPHLVKKILLLGLENWCILISKYGFSKNTPEQGISKSKIPIMIIHGKKDNFIPFYMAEKLFSICASEKEFWADENAGHDMIGWQERAIYQSKIKSFLGKYEN